MGEHDSSFKEALIVFNNQTNAQSAEISKPRDRYSEMVARYENGSIQSSIQKLNEEKNKTGETLSDAERGQLNDTLLEAYALANRIGQEIVESIDTLRNGEFKEDILQRLSKRRQKRYSESSVGEMFRRRDLRKPILDTLDSYASVYHDDRTLAANIHDANRITQYLDDRMGIVVHANTRLIFHYLKKSGLQEKIPSALYDDIVQEGRDGLCEAINTFDKTKGAFATHATIRIKAKVLQAFPHEPASDAREEFLVASPRAENPAQTVIDAVSKEELRKRLKKFLSPKELFVIERRFGLYDGSEYTLAEIARQLGVRRQRVEQILKGALSKLQKRQALFKDFLL